MLWLAVFHELLLWIGVRWQRSSTSLNIWCSWASWTSHLIFWSTQTRRRWHVSFLVLKGTRHWVDDCYPCDGILRWVLHTNVCSWSQAGHTAKPERAHSSAVVSPYICARKSEFNCRAEAQFEEQRAHASILEKKKKKDRVKLHSFLARHPGDLELTREKCDDFIYAILISQDDATERGVYQPHSLIWNFYKRIWFMSSWTKRSPVKGRLIAWALGDHPLWFLTQG